MHPSTLNSHTHTPFFRFYRKAWANKVFSCDLNRDNIGTFLRVAGSLTHPPVTSNPSFSRLLPLDTYVHHHPPHTHTHTHTHTHPPPSRQKQRQTEARSIKDREAYTVIHFLDFSVRKPHRVTSGRDIERGDRSQNRTGEREGWLQTDRRIQRQGERWRQTGEGEGQREIRRKR